MKRYIIYSMQTDEKIGEVEATNIINAELYFCKNNLNFGSDEIYALTAEQ